MNYKIGVLGASGRMGQEIACLLAEDFSVGGDHLEFSDAVALSDRLSSIEGIPVRKIDEDPREPVHVWVDFSRPEATLNLLKRIQDPIVIGTTGFSEGDFRAIQEYAQTHPVLLTSNTSPGIKLMTEMLKAIPDAKNYGYDVVASETHHRNKKDSPSGTMKSLLKILEDQGHRNIQVQVARAGDIRGIHTISFISDDEELTITHKVFNRRVFAKGALLAARYLAKKKEPGLYTFQDVENA